jgi:hypothetical protein
VFFQRRFFQESNVIGPVNIFDKQENHRREKKKTRQTKAPEVMLTLLDENVKAGITAEHVLFDS